MKTRIDRNEVLRLRAEGLTQQQAAARLGVCVSTLRKWRRNHGIEWCQISHGSQLSVNRVNDQLRERGLTQMQVAADLGVQAPMISALAAGRGVLLTDGATFSGPAKRLADYLQLPPEWLWADLHEHFGARPDIEPSGLLLDASGDDEEKAVIDAEVAAVVQSAVERLNSPRLRWVVMQRFEIAGGERVSLRALATRLGVKKSRVHELEHLALACLAENPWLQELGDPAWRHSQPL